MIPAPEGFDEWYSGLYPRVLSVLVATTGDVDIAADATRDAFALALERWDGSGVIDGPSIWTYATAFKRAKSRGRRSKLGRRFKADNRTSDDLDGPIPEVWALLADLSEREATTVALRHIGQLTRPEVAQVMGVTLDVVDDTLRGAHAYLGQAMPEPDPPTAVTTDPGATLEAGPGVGEAAPPTDPLPTRPDEDRSPYIYTDDPTAIQVPAPPAAGGKAAAPDADPTDDAPDTGSDPDPGHAPGAETDPPEDASDVENDPPGDISDPEIDPPEDISDAVTEPDTTPDNDGSEPDDTGGEGG